MAVLVYALQYLLTNIFFSVVAALLLNRLNRDGKYSFTELLVYSAGLGTATTSLLLYYLFLLAPGLSSGVYFSTVVSCFLVPAVLVRKDFSLLSHVLSTIKERMKHDKTSWWTIFLFLAGCLVFFLVTQVLVVIRPLTEHDILEYGTQAKVFFRDGFIHYDKDHYDTVSGFYFVGLHGFSFILISVWELIGNAVMHIDKDYFFRSVTTYYGLLIVCVQFFWFSKKDFVLALVTSLLIFTSSGYITTMMVYHLDSYRIFLLMMSMICMLKAIHYNDRLSVVLFGIFAGLSAFSHSIGALLGIVELGIYFLFVKGSFYVRMKGVLTVTILFLVFGGIHYVIDTFWGSGWIFKDIKFY